MVIIILLVSVIGKCAIFIIAGPVNSCNPPTITSHTQFGDIVTAVSE